MYYFLWVKTLTLECYYKAVALDDEPEAEDKSKAVALPFDVELPLLPN